MKLIVGLGNPGEQYVRTRHNAGFMVMDALANKAGVEINKKKFDALYAKTKIKGEDVILLKPMTYMNNSGFALRACMDFFKISPEDLIVIYDDMDTPVGSIRLRPSGSAGGHNGMKSVITAAMQQDFSRIRVGIGRDPNYKIVDYVLSRFRAEEMDDLNHAIEQAVKAAWFAIDHPFSAAMNRYNVKPKKKKAEKPALPGVETYHPAKSDAVYQIPDVKAGLLEETVQMDGKHVIAPSKSLQLADSGEFSLFEKEQKETADTKNRQKQTEDEVTA